MHNWEGLGGEGARVWRSPPTAGKGEAVGDGGTAQRPGQPPLATHLVTGLWDRKWISLRTGPSSGKEGLGQKLELQRGVWEGSPSNERLPRSTEAWL